MPSDPTVRATATLTLALPKVGLQYSAAAAFVGELYVADIGVPPGLYADLGLSPPVGPLFAQSDMLRLA
jgi:NAD(P)H-hydrate epimerase